jgi:hypothetical protein
VSQLHFQHDRDVWWDFCGPAKVDNAKVDNAKDNGVVQDAAQEGGEHSAFAGLEGEQKETAEQKAKQTV